MDPVSVANNSFALRLFRKIREGNKTNNAFYSPLSISSALAMVSLGAAGNTETQIAEVLCFKKPVKSKPVQHAQQTQLQATSQKSLPDHKMDVKDNIHDSYKKLMSELNKAGAPYTLNLANRLYGEQSYKFLEKFLSETKSLYNAKLETVDFKSNAEAARIKVNNWVEKETKEKIKNLLKKGDVDTSTRLVLVNAIYFKGTWEKKFKVAERKLHFRMTKTDRKPVQMMSQTSTFPLRYIDDLDCSILEMPYTGKDLSMLIMLPTDIKDNTTGLEKLEKNLTYDNYMEWTRPELMDNVEVEVSLPQFKLEETYDLKDLLMSMGMVDAFDNGKCDFSCMSSCKDLLISKVVHKTFVEVNEEGTEAAAATAIVGLVGCYRESSTHIFLADHPFLFFIQHNPTRSILFCGRYSAPYIA